MMEQLKLPTIPHSFPYQIGWIANGPNVKISNVCRVPLSIGKTYKESVACDVLLGRTWQFDHDATHPGRKNLYIYCWDGQKHRIRPKEMPKASKVGGQVLLSLSSYPQEFYDDLKGFSTVMALVAKVTEDSSLKIPMEMELLLEEFGTLVPEGLPNELPPIRDIQHHIDLVHSSSFLNLPHYRFSPKECEILQEKVEELLEKGLICESMSPCVVPTPFVPKKDSSWHMYVASQAINKILFDIDFLIHG